MKSLALLIALFGVIAASAQQPIVLTRQNFGVMPTGSQRDTIYVSDTAVARATVGIGQLWDYSFLTIDTSYVNIRSASTLPQFPNAYARLNMFENLTTNKGYLYDDYYAITDTGVVNLGYHTSAQAWNIGEFTSGANDSIFIQDYVHIYDNPVRTLPFPLAYGGSNEINTVIESNGLINISAMGMNQIPIIKRSYTTTRDTVTGWGTLILPVGSGKSEPIPVLLVNSTTETTDSMFVAGQPAPAQFLAAFGLTQGQYTETSSQIFYRENEINAVAALFFNEGNEDSTAVFQFHSKLKAQQGSVGDPALAKTLLAYPNPADNTFTIALPEDARGIVYAQIINSDGARVAALKAEASQSVVFELPANLAPGAYYVIVRSANGKTLGVGNIIKN
ncbi:MAG: T9SS type A sorting domain-containing protein [Chloroflexota bacterium]